MRFSLLAVGFAAGLLAATALSPAPQPPASQPSAARTVHTVMVPRGPTGGINRDVLRAELATALDARASDGDPAEDAPPAARVAPDEPTPKAHEAANAALAVLDAAIGRGAWTAGDRAALLQVLPDMRAADVEALFAELSLAINAGVIVPDVDAI